MAERRAATATRPQGMATEAINQFLAEAVAGGWEDRVRVGRLFTERKTGCQWALGDLAIAIGGPARTIDDHDGRGGPVSRFAQEIGEDENELRMYRAVATAWENTTRVVIVPWTCYRQIHTHEPGRACRAQNCAVSHGVANRDKTRQQVMQAFIAHCEHVQRRPSYRAMQEFLGIHVTPETTEANRLTETRRALSEMQPAERQAVVNEVFASDAAAATAAVRHIAQHQPDAVAEAYADPDTHLAIGRVTSEHNARVAREWEARRERVTRENPALRRLDELSAQTDLNQQVGIIVHAARTITQEIIPRVGDVDDMRMMRSLLEIALTECDRALEPIRVLVETGRTDLDRMLDEVLHPSRENS